MRSRIKSYLTSWRKQQLNTYKGIEDLTLAIWWEIHETGDSTLLIKTKFKATEKILEYCSELWDNIRQQHLDAFGVPDDYSNYLKAIANLADKQLQYAITNDGTDKMDLMMAEIDLKNITASRPNISNLKTKRKIELALGLRFAIDPKVVTVEEYYNDLELAQETARDGKSN